MSSLGRFLLALGLAASPHRVPSLVAAPRGPGAAVARYADLGFPPSLGKPELSALLQRVVDRLYMRGFRHIGDERDFDHGHFLFDASGRPLAILYHTQEFARHEPAGGPFGYLDPDGRNWIQWLPGGAVENARRYRRRTYPATASWDWFRESELPGLERNHTILDKMLDPRAVGLDAEKSKQWVFTRTPCGGSAPSPDSADIRVFLPTGAPVCLALAGS
jgi:hypothetical protein